MMNDAMQDNPQTPQRTNDAAPSPASSRLRGIWFVSGLILWCLALVMLYRTFQGRPNKPTDAAASGTPVAANKEENASDAAADALIEDPAANWDPDGIEDFTLTERSGKTITKQDLLGHDWVVSFIFIDCAGPCPRVTAQMHELQRQLKGTDVRLVTITVNPKADTPERLAKYAKTYEADPEKWLFLTGDMEKIYHLIIHSFKMPVKEAVGEDRKPGYEVLHTTNVLHINPQGVVVAKYNSLNDVEMAQLRQALKGK